MAIIIYARLQRVKDLSGSNEHTNCYVISSQAVNDLWDGVNDNLLCFLRAVRLRAQTTANCLSNDNDLLTSDINTCLGLPLEYLIALPNGASLVCLLSSCTDMWKKLISMGGAACGVIPFVPCGALRIDKNLFDLVIQDIKRMRCSICSFKHAVIKHTFICPLKT